MDIQRGFLFTTCIVLCVLVRTGYTQVIPNDSLYNEQDYLDDINIEGAWSFTTGNVNQAIAILMPGGSLGHEDLASKLSFQTQRIFDSQYLGTPDRHSSAVPLSKGVLRTFTTKCLLEGI